MYSWAMVPGERPGANVQYHFLTWQIFSVLNKFVTLFHCLPLKIRVIPSAGK